MEQPDLQVPDGPADAELRRQRQQAKLINEAVNAARGTHGRKRAQRAGQARAAFRRAVAGSGRYTPPKTRSV